MLDKKKEMPNPKKTKEENRRNDLQVSDTNMLEIIQFLKELTFQTQLLGGCNKEDVLSKIETLTLLYQEVITHLQKRIQELEAQNNAFSKKSALLQEEIDALSEEKSQTNIQLKMMQKCLQEQNDFCQQATVLSTAINSLEENRTAILSQAEKKAKKILFEAERAKESAVYWQEKYRLDAMQQNSRIPSERYVSEQKKWNDDPADSFQSFRDDLSSMIESAERSEEKSEPSPDLSAGHFYKDKGF